MADKLTVKQEKFCQGLFSGLTQREAYKQAYDASKMKDATIDRNAHELANINKVTARLESLTNEFKERNMVTVERIVAQLAKIGFADIKNVVTWSGNRIRIRPSDEVDGTIISEICETETESGGTLKVKLNDRMKALEMMGKHLGMFTDKIDINGSLVIFKGDDKLED